MKKLNIVAGQPVNFIGTMINKPMKFKPGTSKAVPITKFEIFKGKKI